MILNMDETAIQHEYRSSAGISVELGRRKCAEMGWLGEKVKTAGTRAHCTLVAFVCNDNELQKHLPQIFLPGTLKSPLSPADRDAFALLPAPFEYWVGTSGWVTADIVKNLLTRIRRAVHARRPNAKILLLVDAASSHVQNEVLSHANRLHIYLLLVPGGLTWLMQPLDVFVFRQLKAAIREEHRKERTESDTGGIPAGKWITRTGNAVLQVLVNRHWADSFERLGLGNNHDHLTTRLGKYVQSLETVARVRLSDAEMTLMLGRARADVADRLMRGPQALVDAREALALGPPAPFPAVPVELPRAIAARWLGPPLPPPSPPDRA